MDVLSGRNGSDSATGASQYFSGKRQEKKHCRHPAAGRPAGRVEEDWGHIRYMAHNGEVYLVDVLKMQQVSLTTGRVRAVSFHAGGWFFNENTRNKAVPRWQPFAARLRRLLDAVRVRLLLEPSPIPERFLQHDPVKAAQVSRFQATQSLKFSVDEARAAALSGQAGSLLELICRPPQVQLVGQEIFKNRLSPGFILTSCHLRGIRIMLARGARLGKDVPRCWLLHHMQCFLHEMESHTPTLSLWAHCFLRSMQIAGMDLPDEIRQVILSFLLV